MRLASLAVIGLIMTTTPAYAGAPSTAVPAKAACATSLERAEGSSGFQVMRKCDPKAVSKTAVSSGMARQPVGAASNFAQSDDSDDEEVSGVGVVALSLLAAGAFTYGLVKLFQDENGDMPTSP